MSVLCSAAVDCLGGEDLGKCLPYMAEGGYWVIISTIAGIETNIKLRQILTKGLHIVGSMLRKRSSEEKAQILNELTEKLFDTVNPITATGTSQLLGGIVLLIVGVMIGGSMSFELNTSAFVFVYICIASIFGYCLWFTIVKYNSLSKMFIIKFAVPIFASVFGALLLGENIFNIQYLLAFLLIGGGIYITNIH